ncbi:hypothetical protein [Burkholderia lata]|uniref:hypothetical protein n=1 Tax=Burkholderia lata (strain ATCC 17760 / DSM 23089 / LMG 22485 / NCIMB 9086 / R18194 / 383) TaxID=482957 RepID=UPI00399B8103
MQNLALQLSAPPRPSRKQFGPQLLDLRLVPARFLFALLVTGAPVVFQRIVRSCRRPVLALIALVDFIGWTPITNRTHTPSVSIRQAS